MRPPHAHPTVKAVPSADRLLRYIQLALLVLAAGAIYPMLYLRQIYQSSMLQALAIDNAQLGVLYAILGSAFLVSYLPSGWLADRIAPRWLVSFSLAGTGALGMWYATLPGYVSLLAVFCGFGVTTGLTFWASLLKRVKLLATENEQGRFFGVLDGGRGLIEALLATVAIALFAYATERPGGSDAEGLRDVIHLYAYTCLVLGAALALVPDPGGNSRTAKEARSSRPHLFADIRFLAGKKELWLVTAIVFCGYHFFWATYSFSAYLEQDGLGLSATAAGAITTIKLWMRPIGGIGGGWLGDRYAKLDVLALAMLFAALGLIGLIVLPATGRTGVLIALVIFIGLMTYAIRGLYWAVLDDCAIPARVTGLAIGIVSLAGYSPDVFLPLLNGWITERFPGLPGYQIYFAYVVVAGLCGVAAALELKRMLKRKQP